MKKSFSMYCQGYMACSLRTRYLPLCTREGYHAEQLLPITKVCHYENITSVGFQADHS